MNKIFLAIFCAVLIVFSVYAPSAIYDYRSSKLVSQVNLIFESIVELDSSRASSTFREKIAAKEEYLKKAETIIFEHKSIDFGASDSAREIYKDYFLAVKNYISASLGVTRAELDYSAAKNMSDELLAKHSFSTTYYERSIYAGMASDAINKTQLAFYEFNIEASRREREAFDAIFVIAKKYQNKIDVESINKIKNRKMDDDFIRMKKDNEAFKLKNKTASENKAQLSDMPPPEPPPQPE